MSADPQLIGVIIITVTLFGLLVWAAAALDCRRATHRTDQALRQRADSIRGGHPGMTPAQAEAEAFAALIGEAADARREEGGTP